MTDRDLRLVVFGPGERFRVLPPIKTDRPAVEILNEINEAVRPTVRKIQRRQRRRVLAHKHGRVVGLVLFGMEIVGAGISRLSAKWGK